MSISRLETTQSLGAGGQREDEDIMKAIHDEITAVEVRDCVSVTH